nr:11189_t:CDS:2 [Entrophospora candida]
MSSPKEQINPIINIDNRYLGTLFRQTTDRNAQDRYKDVSQEDLFPFMQEKHIPLPQSLQTIIDWNATHSDKIHCFLGCFPYTYFVYFVIENNLFIWEYEKGNDASAIGHIDFSPDQGKFIKSVGLVKPRLDRWIDNAQYVLVIATDKSLHVFGLTISESQGITFHDMSSPNYKTENYSKKTIGSIVGTDNGRIFLIDDGELCELIYDDERWFNEPCRLEVHSLNIINSTLRFIKGGYSNFKSCVVDDTRNMVYAMADDYIVAYYMSKDDSSLKSVGTYSLQEHNSLLKGTLVSIHPIYNTDSPYFWLLAVTSTGHRGYFTCYLDNRSFNWWLYYESPSTLKFKEPNGKDNSSYKLTYTSPNHGSMFLKFIQNKDHIFSEYYFSVAFKNVWTMQEIYNPLYNPKKFDEYSSELISQFVLPQRRFLIYTSSGIYIWAKKRPVDYLKEILLKNQQNLLNDFLTNYGPEQTTAMCLLIGNDQSHLFFQHFKLGFNQLYEGLAFCLSRILRPIWHQKIIRSIRVLGNVNKVHVNIPSEILVDVEKKLKHLKTFFDSHPYYKKPPSQIHLDSSTIQNNSITILYDFLVNMADAISFILLMIEYNLPGIISSVSKNLQQLLLQSTYEDLVTVQQVRSSWHDLVLVIIKNENSPHIENLSRNLETRCPAFCNVSEAKMYQGYEALQKAKKKKNEDEHSTDEALGISLKLFCDCINILTYGTLNNLCQEYKNLGYYEGAIELLLKASQSFESAPEKRASILDLIIKTLRDAGVFSDTMTHNPQKYNPVLQKALNLGTSLNDQAFLFAVYDEFLRADSIQQLFIPPAPFLEDYLNSTGDGISSSISRRKLELYCDFCVVHQQYIRAAEINEYLAQKSGDDLLLKDRLRYLSHAVGHIESAKESNENERSVIVLLQKYRAEFKIAQIQFDILQDIEKISEEEYNNNATSFRKPTKTESISLLNQHLLDAKTLLNDFIIPYDLKERKSELTRVYI